MCILCMNDHVVLTLNPQLKYLLYRSGMQRTWESTHIFEVGTEMKSGARKKKNKLSKGSQNLRASFWPNIVSAS